MIFFLAYELCFVDKMKLFSSILASALVFHLVNSIVIKINPIRVQVRPNHTTNTSSSAAPFSSEISAQFRTTTDKLACNPSSGSDSIAQNQVKTDKKDTEQSSGSRGSTEDEIPSDKMAAQQSSGTESSAERSTTTNLNVTKYFLVTKSSAEYQISTNQMVTLQPAENVSTIFLITTNQSVTKEAFKSDSSTYYSNITGDEVTKHSSVWYITDEIATNGSTFERDVYTRTHPTANATSSKYE